MWLCTYSIIYNSSPKIARVQNGAEVALEEEHEGAGHVVGVDG